MHVILLFVFSAGQRDLLMFAAPAGGLHLPELQQQLPVAPVCCSPHRGIHCSLPVQDLEPRRASALGAAEPQPTETRAADQQQLASFDPPQHRATEIRGFCW